MKVNFQPSFAIPETPENHLPVPQPLPQPKNPQHEWDRHLASASDAVYASDLKLTQKWLEANGATQVECFDRGFTQAVGYVREGHRCLVVRGSQQFCDFVVDGLCFYWGTPAVHFGFHMGWTLIARDVRHWLAAASAKNPGVYLSGHSLGAAVAAVAAVDLSRSGIPIEGVVLFGCPRVGAPEFAVSYQFHGLVPKTRRFVHGQDGVCVIPPPIAYTHVAPPINLGRYDEPIPASWQRPATEGTDWNVFFHPVIGLIPGCEMIGHAILPYFAKEYPNSRWTNPDNTSLGKHNKPAGYAIFFLVVFGAKLLLSVGDSSTWLTAHVGANSLLFWITAAGEAFLFQQAVFFLLFFVPAIARLLLSVAGVAVVFWFFPIVRIDTIAIPILITLGGLLLLILYAFGSGVPDHMMNYYLHALRAAPGRVAAEKLADTGASVPSPPNWQSSGLGFPRKDPAAQKNGIGGRNEGI